MKTAIEWLVNELNSKYGNNDFIITHINEINQAKQMEKQQIIDARVDLGLYKGYSYDESKQSAEQYYTENYGK